MANQEALGEPIDILERLPSTRRRHLRNASYSSNRGSSSPPTTPSTPQAELEQAEVVPSAATPRTPKRRATFRNMIKSHPATVFDSEAWHNSSFFGFYVVFWVVVLLSTMRTLVLNVMILGTPLTSNVLNILRRDIVKVALTDLCMYLLMYVTFGLQYLVKLNKIDWNRWGWKLQHLWQFSFLWVFVAVAKGGDYPWIARIFLLLHSIVMVMKMHSYAMYNGHLHGITNERETCLALQKAGIEQQELTIEIQERIDFCDDELNIQSKKLRYPDNVTIKNFFMYTMYPTLVYQLEYPRTPCIRWGFVAKKLAATFGLFIVLIIRAEMGIYPVAMEAVELRDTSLLYRAQQYPLVLLELIPEFIIIYLITFYLIWDAILNAIAELSYFGDRDFYRDWWNTVRWDKFARDWNVPVHNFLYRHVYHSSISTLQASKFQATMITFFLSALIHELAMYVIFGKLRGYLFGFQLFQIPLEMMSRSKFFTEHPVFGIVLFWVGICVGPSILCSAYLTF